MARSIYIHWPFCLAKCPYCDFNSHVRASVDTDIWRTALLADLEAEWAIAGYEPVDSIFFGGGTPSLMPPALVGSFIEAIAKRCGLSPAVEITLEANPTSVEAGRFAELAAAGVNRVSLGVQALDDTALRFLGRQHGVAEAEAAIGTAQRHFARVSFDLIYARAGQTAESWGAELDRALAHGTGHLSLYQLTIEPGTRFHLDARRGRLPLIDEELAADLFFATRARLSAAGMRAYEVSNHARPGEESRHNLTYWRYGDYLGIGPGAHGRRGGVATTRHRKPETYLQAVSTRGSGINEEQGLTPAEQACEALLMGLRLAEGIDLGALTGRFGLTRAELVDEAKVTLHRRLGYVEETDGRLVVTDAGMAVLNGVLSDIVAPGLVAA